MYQFICCPCRFSPANIMCWSDSRMISSDAQKKGQWSRDHLSRITMAIAFCIIYCPIHGHGLDNWYCLRIVCKNRKWSRSWGRIGPSKKGASPDIYMKELMVRHELWKQEKSNTVGCVNASLGGTMGHGVTYGTSKIYEAAAMVWSINHIDITAWYTRHLCRFSQCIGIFGSAH